MLETDKAKMNRSQAYQAPQAQGTETTDYTHPKFRKSKQALHEALEADPKEWADAFCQYTRLGLPEGADIDQKATEEWFLYAMVAAFEKGHLHGGEVFGNKSKAGKMFDKKG